MRVPIARFARSDFLTSSSAVAVYRIRPRGRPGKGEPSTRGGLASTGSLIRASRRGITSPLNGSNTERMLQAPFARRNALGVVPNRFLKVIVMCCCDENPDAAETSEIAELVLSSKLQAC